MLCGERGIRTPGGVTLNGFQDRRNRPLCHLSSAPKAALVAIFFACALFASAKLRLFYESTKFFTPFPQNSTKNTPNKIDLR